MVAAMPPSKVSGGFADSLTACSSAAENPDGSYIILNNATKESLKNAFADIGSQLRKVRRVH